MKKVVLGTVMVLAMAAGVSATTGSEKPAGKRAEAACCTMEECCKEGAETGGCCMEGCCG